MPTRPADIRKAACMPTPISVASQHRSCHGAAPAGWARPTLDFWILPPGSCVVYVYTAHLPLCLLRGRNGEGGRVGVSGVGWAVTGVGARVFKPTHGHAAWPLPQFRSQPLYCG